MMTNAVEDLQAKRQESIAEEERQQAELDRNMPHPVGFKLLIALPNVEDTYEGSKIVKSSKEKEAQYILSIIGLVVELGADAYKDTDRYPEGPWCKQGDYVMFRANSGTRFKLGGVEYRVLNEDSIDCVVPNPRVITRA